MGRKDWTLLFLGSVFSLVLADAIPPEVAQHILKLAAHGLGDLLGAGQSHLRGILAN